MKIAEIKQHINGRSDLLDYIALTLTITGIFFISLNTGIVNTIFPIIAILFLFSGRWHEKWQIIKNEKIIIFGVLLLIFFIIGIFYSEGSLKYTLQGFFKYTKILYLIFLLPLFAFHRNWKKVAENAFIFGVLVNIIVALLNIHNIAVFGKIAIIPGGYFMHPIYTDVLLAFSMFILANRIADKDEYLWINVGLLLICLYTLFFVYIERTGYLLAIGLLFLFILQRSNRKTILPLMISAIIVIFAIYKFSPTFNQRVHEAKSNAIEYTKNNTFSSIGKRMDFAKYSFQIIKSHPLIGTGTGSFAEVYAKTNGPTIDEGKLLGHPHNEFIFITIQIGLLGLGVFLFWLLIQWLGTYKLSRENKLLAQGLIITFVLNGFTNVVLSINATGMLYIVFLSIYFASKYSKSNVKSSK